MSGNAGRDAGSAAQHSQMRADRGAGVPWGISGLSPRSMTARAAWMPFRPAKGICSAHDGIRRGSGARSWMPGGGLGLLPGHVLVCNVRGGGTHKVWSRAVRRASEALLPCIALSCWQLPH